jgi:hypothetical protein
MMMHAMFFFFLSFFYFLLHIIIIINLFDHVPCKHNTSSIICWCDHTNLVKSNVIHTIIVFFFFLSLLRFPHISIVLWQHIHHFHYHPHSNLCWRCSTEAVCLFVSFVVLSLFLLSLFSSCCSFCYF